MQSTVDSEFTGGRTDSWLADQMGGQVLTIWKTTLLGMKGNSPRTIDNPPLLRFQKDFVLREAIRNTMLQILPFALAGSVLVILAIRFILSTLRPTDFPPGPPTLPGIGNIHQIPASANFVKFASWARQYGSVLGLKVGPDNLIVFNKASHVRALWVQRGASYAARPRTAIPCDYVLPDDHHRQVVFMSPEFQKIQRAATRHHLGSVGFEKMKPFQQAFAARLANDLLNKPDDFRLAFMRWGMGTPLYSEQFLTFIYISFDFEIQTEHVADFLSNQETTLDIGNATMKQ